MTSKNLRSRKAFIPSPILISFTLISLIPVVALATIWCYSCNSNNPGCGEDGTTWPVQRAITCPQDDDKCVKITERTNNEVMVYRDCLSNVISTRSDVPGDKFEGCRPSSPSPKVGSFVLNLFVQEDKRAPENVTYCFCEYHHWCNSSSSLSPTIMLNLFATIALFTLLLSRLR